MSEGMLYVCAIKDVWSNRVVGCSIDARMTTRLVVRTSRPAAGMWPDRLHPGRGGQVRGCEV